MKKTSGYSLIEVTVVIAVLSIITTLAAVMLHGLMGADRLASGWLEQQNAFAALAETFRGDVHAAKTFHPPADAESLPPRRWEFKRADDSQIVYCWRGDELTRETTVAAGVSRESFPLPPGATVLVENASQGETTLLTLLVEPGPTAAGAPGRPSAGLRVEARLARDCQLAEIPTRAAADDASPEPPDAKEEPAHE